MRVLVVEDSYLIAYSVVQMLTDFGCTVVGPVSTAKDAIRLIETAGCDAAILDVNLGAESSLPIAEKLSERHTPFLFVTGYSSPALAQIEFSERRRLRKPLSAPVLHQAMVEDFIRRG
jgi:CheY-like chemotaxis protein